jgi:primosomal protein N' (replication factor Y)
MTSTAEVFVNITARSLDKSFTYLIPDNFAVTVGCRVLVPFGPRKVEGFVMAINKSEGEVDSLKTILSRLDGTPWFDHSMILTAKAIADYYLCPLADALRLFIPGKSGIKSKSGYVINQSLGADEHLAIRTGLTLEQKKIVNFIAAHGFTGLKDLERSCSATAADVKRLVERHLIIIKQLTTKAATIKTEKEFVICAAPEQLALADLSRKPAQSKLLQLLQQGCCSWKQLKQQGVQLETAKKLEQAGLIAIHEVQSLRSSYSDEQQQMNSAPAYTTEQQAALAQILPAIASGQATTFLLHGVTGSGKTEVYLAATAEARRLGKQVIVLVPEIALTGQIISRYKARFSDDIVVIHSRLSLGERFDGFQRMQEGSAGIVIGARSALFAPAPDLGLIILDEEHEFTYKQEETPRYHARTVALFRAKTTGATVVLGSATPSLESFYEAKQGNYQLLSLTKRIDGSFMPRIKVIDLTAEMKAGRWSVITEDLASLLTSAVGRGEQAIVLINRRGYSTFVLCRECGHVIRCPHCAISLVYHAVGQDLRCHYCRQTFPLPDVCPVCQSRYIKYFGTGTQKVEAELAKLLPQARIVRMDHDTTARKFAHDRILTDFSQGKYDVLLGTQMVAKGHDIHNVTAVGVVSADTALNLPDFRAAERTFALITQAAGRAGRGAKAGEVVVQTYNPEHYAVICAAKHDYEGFYQEEIEFRRQLGYPPFCHIIKIIWQGMQEDTLRKRAEQAVLALKAIMAEASGEILGPVAAPVSKIQDMYRVIVLIKTNQLAEVRTAIRTLGFHSQNDMLVDVDPVSLM